jgi:hypothetical protein
MMKDIFLPHITDVERRVFSLGDTYRFALHVASNITDLYVSKIENTSIVTFSKCDRVEVMRLRRAGTTWNVEVPTHINSGVWNVYASSTRLTYLAKAVTNRRTLVYEAVTNAMGSLNFEAAERDMVLTCVRNSHHHFSRHRPLTINYREMLTSEAIGDLLRVFFNESTAMQVSNSNRNEYDTVRIERDKRKNAREDIKNLMTELFAKPKWLIAYLPDTGYRVSGIDVSCTWHNIVESGQAMRNLARLYVTTHPVQFYETLEDLPTEIRDKTLGQLTFHKMYLKNRCPHHIYNEEPNDLIPTNIGSSEVVVSEELSSVLLRMNNTSVLMINQ